VTNANGIVHCEVLALVPAKRPRISWAGHLARRLEQTLASQP
jgi:hypothetical protein